MDRPWTLPDLAARRLFLLAEAYTDPSLAFLRQFASGPFDRVLDLGCGPGYTTRLLHETVGAGSTIGIDKSEHYIDLARSGAPSGVEFLCHDVLGKPPIPRADLVYAVCHLLGLRPSRASGEPTLDDRRGLSSSDEGRVAVRGVG